jgi:hypothetical protein
MFSPAIPFDSYLASSVFFAPVPGPDRKRSLRPYLYRLTYYSTNPEEVGCAMTWEVIGGRHSYQVALEREWDGTLRWHCTCADAVYRGEQKGHLCKHVRSLLALGRPGQQLACETMAKAG